MKLFTQRRAVGCAAVFAAAVVSFAALTAASTWPMPRTPPVDMRDLAIDESVFPSYWQVCAGPGPYWSQARRGDQESVFVILCTDGGEQFEYTVFRYRNELDAALTFRIFLREDLPRRSRVGTWTTPGGWSSDRLSANSVKFMCLHLSDDPPRENCRVLARYDEFIVLILTGTSAMLTMEDLEQVLQSVDQRMVRTLAPYQ